MAQLTVNINATVEEVELIKDALEDAWFKALERKQEATKENDLKRADYYRDKMNELNALRQQWK